MSSLVYRPGPLPSQPAPLARYLPRLPQGAAAGWLKDNLPPSSWVIDPFGASPDLALEVAQAGYRLLVAANNPIAQFLIEMAAAPPSADQIQAALAELSASRRGDERLEPHLLGLYNTRCDQCGQTVSASAFIWEWEARLPSARIYTCSQCENSGEFPIIEEDLQTAAKFSTAGPHRARALERVAAADSPDRKHVEEALDVYIPRAVYALFTLVNRLDGLSLTDEQRRVLHALVLSAFDRANTLWPVPSARARPKQLTVPPRFRENNIWLALEEAASQWVRSGTAVPLATWPAQPPKSGGICLFEGRLKDLIPQTEEINIQAVISALPRPNQAFWTLSALWAGWLWGRPAVGPFAGVLRRRRYDWAWHTTALESALRHLGAHLQPDTPFFGLVTESEPGFDAAALIAADLAGFQFQGQALRRRAGQSQYLWKAGQPDTPADPPEPEKAAGEAGLQYLAARGESSHYLHLQNAALAALIQQRALPQAESTADTFSTAREALQFAFTFRSGFLRYKGSEHSLEVGRWWLKSEKDLQPPLADRVEKSLVNFLLANPGAETGQIDAALCAEFPGLLTPEAELVSYILSSYAEEDPPGRWQIKSSDSPSARIADIEEMQTTLRQLAEKLGFTITNEDPLRWRAPDGETCQFHIIASAVLGDLLYETPTLSDQNLVVLPGGRAELVLYKLKRDLRLELASKDRWHFLKFRQVRQMAANPALQMDNLLLQFKADPLAEDDPQIKMF